MFCDNIRRHYPFPQQCNALVANVLLYHTDQEMLKHLEEAGDNAEDKHSPENDEDPKTQKNVGRRFSSDWKRLKKSFNENNL